MKRRQYFGSEQATKMNLDNILTESCNYVEIYICPDNVRDTNEIDVGHKSPLQLGSGLGNGTKQELREYHHRDMAYIYDLENDAQRVVRKLAQSMSVQGNMFAISFIEEVLSSHRFPCTNNIAHITKITRTTYRINNRMFLVHDKDETSNYYYIRYHHSGNVDTLKMQQDLDRAIGHLKKQRLVRTS